MSKSRIAIRILLVLLLVGVCWIGYQVWARSQPGYHMKRAEGAIARQDFAEAEIHLKKILKEEPKNARANKAMADVLVAREKAKDENSSYATNAQALRHLALAAEQMPDDLELQKNLLSLYMRTRRYPAAATVAQRVVKAEPENPDALFALAWRATTGKKASTAEKRFQELSKVENKRPFQTLALKAQLHRDAGAKAKLQGVLQAALDLADKALTDDPKSAQLDQRERQSLGGLLVTAVGGAADAETARARMKQVISIGAKLAAADIEAKRQPDNAARPVAEAMTVLRQQFSPEADDAADRAAQRRLATTAHERVWKLAIDRRFASPIVFLQSGLALYESGRHEDAAGQLDLAIEAIEKLPPERRQYLPNLLQLQALNKFALRQYKEAGELAKKLVKNEKTAGRGHLLAGGVASAEGKHAIALSHYQQAQRKLGNTILVRMALARTYIELKQWQNALPHVASLRAGINFDDAEQRAWAVQNNITPTTLSWMEFVAHLGLNQWEQAKARLESLKGSKLEPRAVAAGVIYLMRQNRGVDAEALLSEARGRLPEDLLLVRAQTALWRLMGKAERAEKLVSDMETKGAADKSTRLFVIDWRIRKRQFPQALAMLEKMEQEDDADQAAIAGLKIRMLLMQGKTDEALAAAKALQESPTTAALGNFWAAVAQLKEEDLKAAAENLAKAADASPNPAMLNLLRGRVEAQRGDFASAVDALGATLDVTSLNRVSGVAFVRAAMRLARQQGPAAAAAKLAPLLAARPRDPYLQRANAEILFMQGKNDEAMLQLSQLAQNPKTEHQTYAYYRQALAWAQLGRHQQALNAVKQARTLNPEAESLWLLEAHVRLQQKDNQTVLRMADDWLKKRPSSLPTLIVKSVALRRLNQADAAVRLMEALIEKKPDYLPAHQELASNHLERDRLDAALDVYRRAAKAKPDNFALVTAQVQLLLRQKKAAEAQQLAAASIKAGDPAKVVKQLALAQVFHRAEQNQQAEQWAQRAFEAGAPNQKLAARLMLGTIALNRGLAGQNRKDLEAARDHFAAIVQEHPTHMIAGNNLAWLLATEFGQPEEAVRIVDRVRGKRPITQLPTAFLDTLAEAYCQAGRVEEAGQMLEKALTYRQNDAEFLYRYGVTLAKSGQTAASRTMLERAIQIGLPDDKARKAQQQLDALSSAAP